MNEEIDENVKKLTKRHLKYYKGAGKFVMLFVGFLIVQELLALFFPLMLKDITKLINNGGTERDIIMQGIVVLVVVIAIMVVNFFSEYFGSVATEHYSNNLRAELYAKIQSLPTEKVNEIGSSTLLPLVANDCKWLKDYQKRLIILYVYFPVAIIGSFIMLLTLNTTYALIAAASIPVSIVFFIICSRALKNPIKYSIIEFDNIYKNVKEGIIGAKEIRIQNKAGERTEDFTRGYKIHRRQLQSATRATNLSVSFHAFLYMLVTACVIMYCAYVMPTDDVAGKAALVTLNAAIMYINKIWTGAHYLFTLFAEYAPRAMFTFKRYDKVFQIKSPEPIQGTKTLTFTNNDKLAFNHVSYRFDNNSRGLTDVNLAFPNNTRTAIVGAIGSGKHLIFNMFLRFIEPTSGNIVVSGTPLASIDENFFRKNVLAVCPQEALFIPGTVRENLKTLNPDATDEDIYATFAKIGCLKMIQKFDNFLDYQIGERSTFSASIKNTLNIVRTLLKPASIYVFNLCFEHIKDEYVDKLVSCLTREKKTAIFITHMPSICKKCDNVYFMKSGRIVASGKHTALLKNDEYKNMLALTTSQILATETMSIPESTNPELADEGINAPIETEEANT